MSGGKDTGKSRTKIPSSLNRVEILVRKELKEDCSPQQLWKLFFRVALPGLFLALQGIGFLTAYSEFAPDDDLDDVTVPFPVPMTALQSGALGLEPNSVWFAGANLTAVSALISMMQSNVRLLPGTALNFPSITNLGDFKSFVEAEATSDNFNFGVFVDEGDPNWSYHLLINGSSLPNMESMDPSNDAFVDLLSAGVFGAQYIVDESIAILSDSTFGAADFTTIQRLPEIDEGNEVSFALLFVPPFYLLLGIQFSLNFYLAPMTRDKRKQIVRGLGFMGVSELTYWMHWVVYHVFDGLLTAAILTTVFFVMKYVVKSNAFLVFLNFALTMIGIGQFAAMVPRYVTSESVATLIPFLALLLVSGIGAGLLSLDPSQAVFSLLSFLSPWLQPFQYVPIYIELDWVGTNEGVNFSNAVEAGIVSCILAQLAQIVLYLFLMWILYGDRNWKTSKVDLEQDPEAVRDESHFEELPAGSREVLTVRGLTKDFKVSKSETVQALRGLNMTVLKNEVFGFLGPNGSGKSTTLNILASEYLPTSGNANFHFSGGVAQLGSAEGQHIRNRIGVCAQEDLLFDNLTCREHLTLFARLKGGMEIQPGQTVAEAIKAEVEKRIKQVNFTTPGDEDRIVKHYSGGMKRKVSIAIAFLGDPELVLIDEATAGVDAWNRRKIWNMIEESKEGRSIILTTHFMDEADVLSDRIGILSRGKMVTCGTSLFLKHHFGAGYALSYRIPQDERSSVVSAITSTIEGATFQYDKGNLQHWTLPPSSEKQLPKLLRTFESTSSLKDLDIKLTTLEEVFLRIETEQAAEDNEDDAEKQSTMAMLRDIWSLKNVHVDEISFFQKAKQVGLIFFHSNRREADAIFFIFGLPLFYVILGFLFAFIFSSDSNFVEKDPVRVDLDLAFVSGAASTTARIFGVSIPSSLEIGSGTFEFITDVPPAEALKTDDGLRWFFDQGYLFGGLASPGSNGTFYANGTIPMSLALMMRLTTAANISSTIEPLRYRPDDMFDITAFMLPLFVGIGFVSLTYIVIELATFKENKLYTPLKLLGISRVNVYAGGALYGLATSWFPFVVVAIICALAFQNPVVGNGGRWLAFVLTLLAYAWSILPFGLSFEPLFPDIETARNWMPMIMLFLLTAPFVVYSTMTIYTTVEVQATVGDFFAILPPFAFQRMLAELVSISNVSDDPNVTWALVWSWETRVWYLLLMMIVVGFVFWGVVLIQIRVATNRTIPGHEEPSEAIKDEDVENERANAFIENEDGVAVRDLVKRFRTPPRSFEFMFRYIDLGFYARLVFGGCKDPFEGKYVDHVVEKGVSFTFSRGGTFALLGPNGSGKTVLSETLIRDLVADGGEISIFGVSNRNVEGSDQLYRERRIAIVQQIDTIFPQVTVREQINFYVRVRGLKPGTSEPAHRHVDAIIKALGLGPHLQKRTKSLSGGFKRRLCFACALIGAPELLILDEVSTGVDPSARHKIWSILKPELAIENAQDEEIAESLELPATLLATHYLDEAQELASKIGILIDGKFETIGTLSRLQEKHCDKLFADITFLDSSDPESSEERVVAAFQEAGHKVETSDSFPGRLRIQIALKPGARIVTALADAFAFTENNKERLGIQFYSIAVMDLEKIFIELSRKQFETDALRRQDSELALSQ